MMNPSLVDISVLMLFHARADHFSQVWAEVKKARPSRLFLYQDGPRLFSREGTPVERAEDSKDWQGILECRELVKDDNIDWECEVHRLYQEKNYGCDPSEYISQRWAFSITDKCIVLEDDDVPSQSFFPFCKEMLDKYEDDDRVTMISGFNTEASTLRLPENAKGEVPDYFFTRAFSIWGWASWARVVNNWEGDYGFVEDAERFALLKEKVMRYKQRDDMPRMCQAHHDSGIEHYETIFWAYMLLHDGLAIMPRVNMINNIGLEGGTHYSTQLHLQPKRLRYMFEMPRKELSFPLSHPDNVGEHPDYQRLYYLRNAWNNPWRKVQYSLEELWLNASHGNWNNIWKSIIARIKKNLGYAKY